MVNLQWTNIAMENCHLQMIYSYVKLPEGKSPSTINLTIKGDIPIDCMSIFVPKKHGKSPRPALQRITWAQYPW